MPRISLHAAKPLARAIHLTVLGLMLAPVPMLVLTPNQAVAQNHTHEYRIASGPLGAALSQFATAAGVTLSFAVEQTKGLTSLGLQGRYTLDEGLAQLLVGSGLQAQRQANGGYILVTAVSLDTTDSINLDAMRVEDNSLGTITEHTKSYTPGTIASATRLVLTPRETPQTVTVITRQHMDDFNLTNINKVIDHTPGVTRISNDYRSWYYARGFAINNFQYDGIPTLSDSVNAIGQTSSDMIQYDRVEVIKGASGLTTGAGSPGATINLVRKKPTHELSGHITAEAGRWDNYRTEWDIGGPLNDSGSIRGRVAAAFQDKQSFLDYAKEQTRALYGILEVDLSPQTMLTLGGNYDKRIPDGDPWQGVPIWDSHNNEIDMPRSFNPAATWSYSESFSHAFFAQLDHEFDNGWNSRLYYTFQRNASNAKLGSIHFIPDAEDGSVLLGSGKYRYKTKTYALEGYARGPFELFGRIHELAVGLSGYHNKVKGTDYNYTMSAVDNFWDWSGHIGRPDWEKANYRIKNRVDQRAFYASARFSLTDDLAMILGSRVTNYKRGGGSDMRETGEVVPFASITYDLNDYLSAYASYTKIFQPQSLRDENYSVLQPNEGNSYEGGFKGEWFNGRLNASLAYFEIRQDNRAERVRRDPERNYVIYREVKAKSKGIELEITGELIPGWNIQAGLTHQVIREDANNNKLTTQQPENQLKIYTTYRLPGMLSKFTIGGGANYQGTTWRNSTDALGNAHQYQQESFWLLNMMGKYQITDKISAILNINNLLDKYYYTSYDDGGKMYGEPRNMMLTTRWDF